MVKILCLHGAGCSSEIMEKQMASITKGLDDTYEWVYLDGEFEAPRARGLPQHMQGGSYRYYQSMSPAGMREACDLLASAIEDEGPFDGVVGFSQGAAVAMSFLLDLEINHPDEPLPFKWGVFFSSTTPASPDESFLKDEMADAATKFDRDFVVNALSNTASIQDDDSAPVNGPNSRISLLSEKNRKALMLEMVELVRTSMMGAAELNVSLTDVQTNLQNGTASIDTFPRVYHPTVVTQRIRMPSIHSYGKRDMPALTKQAKLVTKLCAESTVLEHSAAHDIPREPKDVDPIVSKITRMIEKSKWAATSWS